MPSAMLVREKFIGKRYHNQGINYLNLSFFNKFGSILNILLYFIGLSDVLLNLLLYVVTQKHPFLDQHVKRQIVISDIIFSM